MKQCPTFIELPPPPAGKTGWPWHLPNNQQLITNNPPSSLPRISIVMPCFNAVAFIEEALRSVLLQGYPDLELIVFDGGSTDGTVEVIKRYAPWLSYWASEPDCGQSHAINKGLERATGELFNWFNADDVMCEGALEALAALHIANPSAVGICGVVQSFDEGGALSLLRPVAGSKEALGDWAVSAFIPQPGALFNCRMCKDIGGVNERLHYVMDIDLLMKLADRGAFVTTERVITLFRQHAGSKTVSGDIPGLVELIAVEFNLGMPRVAERLLERRMTGHASLAIDKLGEDEIKKIVDRWTYLQLFTYTAHRLLKNLALRFSKH
jgi:glycosyltransferase involved in cell wall biosynthesis